MFPSMTLAIPQLPIITLGFVRLLTVWRFILQTCKFASPILSQSTLKVPIAQLMFLEVTVVWLCSSLLCR